MAVGVTGIDVHTYLVKDADRAIAFYRDVLGLPLSHEMKGQGAEFDLSDGTTFGLWKMDDGSWARGGGVMFAVPDIAVAVEQLKKNGITAFVEETPVCTMAIAEDTEGNQFVLHKRKP